MSPGLLMPLAVAVALALIVAGTHRRLPPRMATRVLIAALGAVVLAAIPTVWVLSVGYLTHLPLLGGQLHWCAKTLGVHESIPMWAGLPATAVTVLGAARARRVVRRYRRSRWDLPGDVAITPHADAFAYTLPGRGGQIVLSHGITELLDADETSVVLAHEAVHAKYRHDRYILVARIASAMLPIVRPLASRLNYSLERWADEEAAAVCGDRGLVAETLGKVALHGIAVDAVPAFAGLGVIARVKSLLDPPVGAPRPIAMSAMWACLLAVTASAVTQLHHLGALASALCLG